MRGHSIANCRIYKEKLKRGYPLAGLDAIFTMITEIPLVAPVNQRKEIIKTVPMKEDKILIHIRK